MVPLLALFFGIVQLMGQGREIHGYVGWQKCDVCHGMDAIGNQCKVWLSTGHARAYEILASDQSKSIALKVNVAEPQNDRECLKCHTTGGGKVDAVKREGVGCEACHGPGSGYYSMGNHVEYSDPTKVTGYMRAIQHGMFPILAIVAGHLKNRERLCLSCHDDSRPCSSTDSKTRTKKKMTIQVIDSLERGTIKLKHPSHR